MKQKCGETAILPPNRIGLPITGTSEQEILSCSKLHWQVIHGINAIDSIIVQRGAAQFYIHRKPALALKLQHMQDSYHI